MTFWPPLACVPDSTVNWTIVSALSVKIQFLPTIDALVAASSLPGFIFFCPQKKKKKKAKKKATITVLTLSMIFLLMFF